MTTTSFDPTSTPAWQQLKPLAADANSENITDYFNQNPNRHQDYALRQEGLYLDYSKNLVSDKVRQCLTALAEQSPLKEKMAAMFAGERINTTEDRSVLHTVLRDLDGDDHVVDGANLTQAIAAELDKMDRFAESVRSGNWTGETGKAITDIVNIGIGGSDLGPKMVCKALEQYAHERINFHFISNVDGAEINSTLKRLNPETSLFIISSKTFTTQETLMNAEAALNWYQSQAGMANAQNSKHFIAVTANPANAKKYGIADNQIFEFWDWVGGRYSLWSAIGLSIALCIGMDHFKRLLAGAKAMDDHFRTAPYGQNMPVILALLGIWYSNFLGAETVAVIPYCERMGLLPSYLQQLDMESNGKSVNAEGEPIDYDTGPIIWGQTGTNGQHAFFQLLHQGTRLVPLDLIATISDPLSNPEQHRALLGNLVAQSAALMAGESGEGIPSYKSYPGNRPTNVLLMDELSPYNLGSLIALYEHKVFTQGIIWNINSFDQWGVELGKKLAKSLLSDSASQLSGFDSSTQALMALIQK